MKLTPLEIRNHELKKSMRGYDVRDVELLRELAADALEDAAKEIMRLDEKCRTMEARLAELVGNETILKDAITSAQRMAQDMKNNARKEAELIVAEAKLQGEEIVHNAQLHATRLQDEIYRLRQQRIELQNSIKAVIDYHTTTLLLEEDEAKVLEEDVDKLRFLPKKP